MIRIIQGQRVKIGVAALLALLWAGSASSQVSIGGTSSRAFGARERREPVATVALLPATGNRVGSDRFVIETLSFWVWTGSAWIEVGPREIPPIATVAAKGPCVAPRMVAVTDALSVFDCLIGGGASEAMCICRNGSWTAFGNAGGGTVTSVGVSLSGLSWLAVSGSPVTTSGTFTVGTASGQTPGRVLGTCGAATAFGPCALTPTDLPALPYLSNATPYALSSSPGGAASSVAADSVTNSGIASAAAIAESKLALNHPTHDNANDPTSGQKAALVGSSGTPSSGNAYVTDADPRNVNARTPVAHTHPAADTTSGVFAGARIPAVDLAHLASICVGPAKILQWDDAGEAACIATPSGPSTYAASASAGGPATTAAQLAANGANCSAGRSPLGVDTLGAAEGCFAVLPLTGGALTGPLRVPNGAAYTDVVLQIGEATTGFANDGGILRAWVSGAEYLRINSNVVRVVAGGRSKDARVSSAENGVYDINPFQVGGDQSTGMNNGPSTGQVVLAGSGVAVVLADGVVGMVTVNKRLALVPSSGWTCNSGAKGQAYVASGDGSWCTCNGTAWTATPITGVCN